MSKQYNPKRAIFFPSNDLAYSLFKERVVEVFAQQNELAIKDINDCIEVHESKRIADTHCHLFSNEEIQVINEQAPILKAVSCKIASNTIEKDGISCLYNTVEDQYSDAFWSFIAECNLYGSISKSDFLALAKNHFEAIPHAIKNRTLVNKFDQEIAEAFKDNAVSSAELIIRLKGAEHSIHHAETLPDALGNNDIDDIMLRYLRSDRAKINYVCILEQWPKCAYPAYKPSPEVLVAAKKRKKQLEDELFANPSTMHAEQTFGVGCSKSQRACISPTSKNNLTLTYSYDWLSTYHDPATILNNFIYLFEFADYSGLLTVPARKHEKKSLFEIIGMNPRGKYPTSPSFSMRNGYAMLQVRMYMSVLQSVGSRLENAIEWFFNTYIFNEFGIEGFSINLPSENASSLDKCKAMGPEIERILKSFKLYCERGNIDDDYFPHISIKNFDSIPSLIDGKYYIENDEYEGIASWLFSNQSLISFLPNRTDYDSFVALITSETIYKKEFDVALFPVLDEIADRGLISISTEGAIETTSKIYPLKLIWENGAISRPHASTELISITDELVKDNLIQTRNSLFTPDESDYMNYMFNNAKFSNPLALRNKYDHANGFIQDPNAEDITADYCRLLVLTIFILLKINDELSIATGKGGLDDLVDWPLIGN